MRLVTMQLTAMKAPDDSLAAEQANPDDSPPGAMTQEYEARRCHVCQCKFPSFGFGPPLRVDGSTIWSCLAHRDEVDRVGLNVTASSTDPQPRLL